MTCPLCDLEKKTHWYYECDEFVICDCLTCGVPMLVWREHTMTVDYGTLLSGILRLGQYAREKWGQETSIRMRFKQRLIPDHFHVHAERRTNE